MNCLLNFSTPQLQKNPHRKVRDSVKIDEHSRLIVVLIGFRLRPRAENADSAQRRGLKRDFKFLV